MRFLDFRKWLRGYSPPRGFLELEVTYLRDKDALNPSFVAVMHLCLWVVGAYGRVSKGTMGMALGPPVAPRGISLIVRAWASSSIGGFQATDLEREVPPSY
ncbi:UNVERIFIED_CONTAM: hypothetical protein Sradi_5809900 [Sesamum radiatum]|uniref:Uncharacterized protein n=1 Tax=Sesamum radiatum TaxID=300843 RepID=A0AAW2KR83_SESRA